MIRIGMVGTGDIARTHASFLSKMPDVSIAAVFDVVQEKAGSMANDFETVVCRDLESMLDKVDAVYICTPPQFHREAAVRTAE